MLVILYSLLVGKWKSLKLSCQLIGIVKQVTKLRFVLLLVAALAIMYAFSFSFLGNKIDFNTQVKPLLNRRCIICHGGVKRQGDFSLLFRQDALAITKSGKPAIIPGDPDGSEMVKRLTHHDPEERMPYKQEPLSKEEINTLRQWVKDGAEWGDHWAFTEVKPTAVPLRHLAEAIITT